MNSKSKFKRLLYMLGVLVIVMILEIFVYNAIFQTITNAIFGSGLLSSWVTVILSAALTAVLVVFPMYFRLRSDGTERILLLEHFSDKEFNRDTLKEYILKHTDAKSNLIIFAITLVLILMYEYLSSAIVAPVYFLIMLVSFAIIFGAYTVYEFLARKCLYGDWYAERLHK